MTKKVLSVLAVLSFTVLLAGCNKAETPAEVTTGDVKEVMTGEMAMTGSVEVKEVVISDSEGVEVKDVEEVEVKEIMTGDAKVIKMTGDSVSVTGNAVVVDESNGHVVKVEVKEGETTTGATAE